MNNTPPDKVRSLCYQPKDAASKIMARFKGTLATYLARRLGVAEELVTRHLTDTVRDTKGVKGDLALPCFAFGKLKGVPPPSIAQEICATVEDPLPSGWSIVKAVGPYLNFWYDLTQLVPQLLTALLSDGSHQQSAGLGSPNVAEGILLEYSSPNIAKAFHVGHLRTTLIGACLARVLRYAGFKVVTINHLGDWGTQFGFVWAGAVLNGLQLTASTYAAPPLNSVDGLLQLYVYASQMRKEQDAGALPVEGESVNSMARGYFLKLEQGEEGAVQFWRHCLDVSMKYFKEMYADLGIDFDHYTGESFYRPMLPEIETQIRQSGILQESDGALGIELGKPLGFVRIFTEDGRSLYITRDIAAAVYRHNTFKPYLSLYVVGAAQTLHLEQLQGILKCMNHPAADEIHHIPFGNVPDMSTRGGGAISLEGFLAEARERALAAYQDEVAKRPEGIDEGEVSNKLAIGATYYYFLSHTNNKEFHFRWEEALNLKGDSGPYLQYALSRINSIKRNAGVECLDGLTNLDNSSPSLAPLDYSGIIESYEGVELLLQLSRFEHVVAKVCETYEPMILAQYLMDLAKAFSRAYLALRVVGEATSRGSAHLRLYEATRLIMSRGMALLGVPLVDRM